MVKTAQLSEKEKKKIVRQIYKKGKSTTELAQSMDRSRGTINYFLKKWAKTKRLGSKTRFTEEEKKAIVKLVRKEPSVRLCQIKKQLVLDASLATITRYLNKKGCRCINSRAAWFRTES